MKILAYNNEAHNITGDRIRDLREKHGMSQEQLAAKMQIAGIQINQKAISRIESRDRVVTDYELKQFAIIFRVTADSLLNE